MEQKKKKMQARIITLALLTPLVVAMLLSLIYVMANMSSAEAEYATIEGAAVPTLEEMAPEIANPACSFAEWVGEQVDEDAVRETGRPYRILQPGQPVTMDYNMERINVLTDEDGIVLEVSCG